MSGNRNMMALASLALIAQLQHSKGKVQHDEMRRYKPEDRASKKHQRNARKQRYK